MGVPRKVIKKSLALLKRLEAKPIKKKGRAMSKREFMRSNLNRLNQLWGPTGSKYNWAELAEKYDSNITGAAEEALLDDYTDEDF